MSVYQSYKKIPLLTKLLVAMVIGAILGAVVGESIQVISPLGTIFLNLLKMAALPLIIVNLISGIAALDDPKIFGRVGIKIMLYYAFTTVVAISVGLFMGTILQPGANFQLEGSYDSAIETIPSFGETIVDLIPSNIFTTLSNGRFDQTVVFAAIIGVGMLFLKPEDKKVLVTGFTALGKLFNTVIAGIMVYAPIGIMSLMACTVGKYGSQLGGFVAKYLGACYASILVQLAMYSLLYILFTRKSPVAVFKKSSPLIVTAVSTSSSLACVPVSQACADDMGIPRSISSFTVPLGTQVNKDGNGIMLAVSFLFAAQTVNAPMSLDVLLSVIFISLILTTGAGGVPGGGVVSIAIVIDAFGMPLEVVGIISGVFALVDMGYTMMNCLGDLMGTAIVAHSERKHLAEEELCV